MHVYESTLYAFKLKDFFVYKIPTKKQLRDIYHVARTGQNRKLQSN